jgi:hypothetical protein
MKAPITVAQAWSVIAETYWPEGSKPAPDCRTCKSYYRADFHYDYDCEKSDCANGDKYEAAPRVVLWRTETRAI